MNVKKMAEAAEYSAMSAKIFKDGKSIAITTFEQWKERAIANGETPGNTAAHLIAASLLMRVFSGILSKASGMSEMDVLMELAQDMQEVADLDDGADWTL
jgi:hypothetical protein